MFHHPGGDYVSVAPIEAAAFSQRVGIVASIPANGVWLDGVVA